MTRTELQPSLLLLHLVLNIDDAVEITKEYRVYLAAVTETTD